MDVVFPAIISVAVIGYYIAWPIWIAFTTPKADLSRINAHYGGPYTKVLGISRAGMQLGGRSGPNYRKYEITLQRMSDEPVRMTVGVAAGLLGPGNLREYGANGLTGYGKTIAD